MTLNASSVDGDRFVKFLGGFLRVIADRLVWKRFVNVEVGLNACGGGIVAYPKL